MKDPRGKIFNKIHITQRDERNDNGESESSGDVPARHWQRDPANDCAPSAGRTSSSRLTSNYIYRFERGDCHTMNRRKHKETTEAAETLTVMRQMMRKTERASEWMNQQNHSPLLARRVLTLHTYICNKQSSQESQVCLMDVCIIVECRIAATATAIAHVRMYDDARRVSSASVDVPHILVTLVLLVWPGPISIPCPSRSWPFYGLSTRNLPRSVSEFSLFSSLSTVSVSGFP